MAIRNKCKTFVANVDNSPNELKLIKQQAIESILNDNERDRLRNADEK